MNGDMYFCSEETNTGMYIGYNAGWIRVVGNCHPESMIQRMEGSHEMYVDCVKCGKIFVSPKMPPAGSWATKWPIGSQRYGSSSTLISQWASGWTGIAAEDLDVEVDV